jgi:hypothetical protein
MVKLPKSVIQNIKQQFASFCSGDKISFNDLLQLLQRESFFRDALSEAQIYRLSSLRFVYNEACQLLTM